MSIETPCNKICLLDPVTNLCIGCGRSGAEIAGWLGFSADERRTVLADLPDRLRAMTTRQTRGRAKRAMR